MAELVCACFLPWMDAELVVSICLGRAFVGCLFSGSVADGIGRRRAFQLSALPMIMGAALRYHLLFIVCQRFVHSKPVINQYLSLSSFVNFV
uniref:Major facilitator superfamily (MFS) profile domain-containing protein n=1 Tax=Hordeum vulgare subsp. vulgare TaxID=112509 RepID=A0A8I6XZ12_HORVV